MLAAGRLAACPRPPDRPETAVDLDRPLRPEPETSLRPWAGARLGDGVGERWLAGPASLITLRDGSTTTLDALAAEAGGALVGTAGLALYGRRFPLLAKVIDAGEWLSLQVHPDDDLARRLYGPDAVGKDEAWVVLAAQPGSQLATGPAAGSDAAAVHAAIASGRMGLDECELVEPVAGDVLNVRSGTIHAIGAGAFVYEIEQPSDLTFRISDWGRPPTPGRHLHIEEARQAVDPALRSTLVGRRWQLDGGALETPRFRLEIVLGGQSATRRPAALGPDVVTAFGGEVTLAGPGWRESLAPLDTVVVPAGVAEYELETAGGAFALVGSLPR
jgi:mannose-6-phosphate isomerase